MAFFIDSNDEDIVRQAKDSTLRYQRGNVIYYSNSNISSLGEQFEQKKKKVLENKKRKI